MPVAKRQIPAPVDLPFAPYYAAGNAATEAATRAQDQVNERWHDESEASVSRCMKDAGFKYYPYSYVPPKPITEADEPYYLGNAFDIPWLPTTRDEVKKVGYGVASFDQLNPNPFEVPPSDAEKSNQEYYDSLSKSAQDSYDLTLNGQVRDSYDPTLSGTPDGEENQDTCGSKAEAAHPQPTAPSLDFLDPLNPMLDLYAGYFEQLPDGSWSTSFPPGSVHTDPEMIRLGEEYEGCVAESVIGDKIAATGDGIGPGGLFDVAMRTGPDGAVYEPPAGLGNAEDIPEEQASLVGSQHERDIALVDFGCRQETNYVDRYAAVIIRYQKAYLEAHQGELDKMMAQIEDM
jgi:hypothetical protein